MSARLLERLVRCVLGLALFGFGITLFVRAGLGLAPWDVFHLGVAENLDLSLGVVIIVVGFLLLLAWIPLSQRPGVGTVLNAVEIGLVVNLTKPLIGEADALAVQVVMMASGLLVVGLGSALYIGAGLGSGPRDGLMMGISGRTWANRRVSIRTARTAVEASVLAAGFVLGGPIGIGTVAFMVGIGPLVQFLLPHFIVRTPVVAIPDGRTD
ncbi:MAG: YczE/YyaS/YitT family protein [Actinomycetota bacterium]